MDHRYLAIVASVIVILTIGIGFIIRSVFRGWAMPRCWRCGATKVRRSRSAGFLDTAATFLLLRPVRCSGCRERFYAPRFLEPLPLKRRAKASPERALAQAGEQVQAQAHTQATRVHLTP